MSLDMQHSHMSHVLYYIIIYILYYIFFALADVMRVHVYAHNTAWLIENG